MGWRTEIREPVGLNLPGKPERGRIKEARMMYIKAHGRYLMQGSRATNWGDFTQYLEVGDNQFTLRQVDIFGNGNVLRYDASHWCDDYGMLIGLRFSRKPKWAAFFPGAELISAADFEKVRRAAQRSPLWPLQVASSRAAEWGTSPHWLTHSEST
jgi:hypothetical protein